MVPPPTISKKKRQAESPANESRDPGIPAPGLDWAPCGHQKTAVESRESTGVGIGCAVLGKGAAPPPMEPADTESSKKFFNLLVAGGSPFRVFIRKERK